MSSKEKMTFEIEDPSEPTPDVPVKHKALYGLFVASSIVAPYITGAVILTQKKRIEEWGWI